MKPAEGSVAHAADSPLEIRPAPTDLDERMIPDAPPNVWTAVMWTSLRVVGSSSVIMALYFLVPFDGPLHLSAVALVILAVLVLVAVVVAQVVAIIRSTTPGLRAIEALAFFIPLLLVSFASIHFVMSNANPQAFTEPLTRTGALYFTVTVFTTVGFGDISPVSDTARLVVTAQMILDLLILGIGLRVIVGAVRLAKGRRPPAAGAPP